MTDRFDGAVRAALAFLVVGGALAIYAFTNKLDFAQLLALTGPALTLYFGQFIRAPGGPTEVVGPQGGPVPVEDAAPAAGPARKAAKKR